MAGDWIKMRLDLGEDPAVMRMADELGVREEVIVGYCHAFWSWVSRQCHDGTVTGVTLMSLGRRLNLPGFPELLCDVGWLEYDDTGDQPLLTIPHFDRHLSKGAKERVLSSERKATSRARSHATVTEMSRSDRDKTATREEKSREEKSIKIPPKPPKGDSRFDPLAMLLPFQSDRFRDSWRLYVEHRREIKKKLTPKATEQAIKRLGEMGEALAVAAIEHTVSNGWQGLREPESTKNGKPSNLTRNLDSML